MIIFATWPMIAVGMVFWVQWYRRLLFFPSLGRPFRHRWPLLFAPVACAGLLATAEFTTLSGATDRERVPQFAVSLCEFGYLGILHRLFPYFGLSPLTDGVSRDNRAARVASIGGLAGCTLVFAIAPSAIGHASTLLLFDLIGIAMFITCWSLIEWLTRWSEWITVRRNCGWAYFLSCLLVGGGVVSGATAFIIALIASK
jgi:uncharacterized membrane protein YjfL (UPF0719 family)